MTENEFHYLLKKIESNEYKEEQLDLTVSFFGEDPEALILNDEHSILLAKALKQNSYIKDVDLTGNHIGDKGAIALASVDMLNSLSLYSNSINIEGAIALAKSNLKILSLSENFFENEKHIDLINAFAQNKSIIHLNLYHNNLSKEFTSNLINNKTIKTLNLSLNNITDEVLKSLKNNNTLEELNISNNNITDKGIEYILQNNHLETISLNDTYITDEGVKLLSNHPTIKKLSIGGCDNLTIEGLKYFIGSNFEEINVSSNKIPTKISFQFQQAFEQMKNAPAQQKQELRDYLAQTNITELFQEQEQQTQQQALNNPVLDIQEEDQDTDLMGNSQLSTDDHSQA